MSSQVAAFALFFNESSQGCMQWRINQWLNVCALSYWNLVTEHLVTRCQPQLSETELLDYGTFKFPF